MYMSSLQIINMYFPDPKRKSKFTIITKQEHKEVDSSQTNTPKIEDIRICQSIQKYDQD